MESSPYSQMARLHMKLQTDERSRVFARLADQMRLSGHVENAVELLRKGIHFHPSYVSGHIVLGKCYLDLGSLGEAREAFLRALALDSENTLVLKSLGDILCQQGELEEATEHYRRALQLDSANDDIREVVERLARQPGDPLPAEPDEGTALAAEAADFDDLLSEQKEDVSPSVEEGFVAPPPAELAELSPEETELLREEQEQDVGKGPPRGMATATLAEIYFQQGLLDKAIETYRKVLRHHPEDLQVKDRLKELRDMSASQARRKKPSHQKPLHIPKPSMDQETDAPPQADAQEER